MSHKYSSLPLRVTGKGLGANYGEGFFTNELGNTFASESSVSDSDGGEGLFLFLAKTQRRKGFLLAGSKKKRGAMKKRDANCRVSFGIM